MVSDTIKAKRARIFICAAVLSSLVAATDSGADITLEGTDIGTEPLKSEPTYFPVSECRRVGDEEILRIGSQLLSQQVEKHTGFPLSAYTSFPDLVSFEDCGDIIVISSAMGSFGLGEVWRMVFPKSEFEALRLGRIGQRKFILFKATSL